MLENYESLHQHCVAKKNSFTRQYIFNECAFYVYFSYQINIPAEKRFQAFGTERSKSSDRSLKPNCLTDVHVMMYVIIIGLHVSRVII